MRRTRPDSTTQQVWLHQRQNEEGTSSKHKHSHSRAGLGFFLEIPHDTSKCVFITINQLYSSISVSQVINVLVVRE